MGKIYGVDVSATLISQVTAELWMRRGNGRSRPLEQLYLIVYPDALMAALMQIRVSEEAKEDLLEDCGHPKHAPLHLKVTAVSKCDGFEAVKQ